MAVRLALTPEQALAEIERRREQTRLRVARWRERQRNASVTLAGNATSNVTPGRVAQRKPAPPTPPVVSPTSKEVEEVGGLLARFADRGYQHDPEWWLRLAQKCPDVDLYLECSNLAEWLLMPVHGKEECNKRRIGRWMRKSQADAEAGRGSPAPAPRPQQAGLATNGHVPHPPRPPEEPPVPRRRADASAGMIGRAEMERWLAQRALVPFKEKVAAKNGKHP